MVFGNVSRFSDRNEIIFFPVSKQEEINDWKIEKKLSCSQYTFLWLIWVLHIATNASFFLHISATKDKHLPIRFFAFVISSEINSKTALIFGSCFYREVKQEIN